MRPHPLTGRGGIEDFVLRMPKAEIHVHLEGSMRPAVLLELARRNGVALPADDEAGLARWFRFRNFEHFVQVYLTCSKVLRNPEDFQLLATDFLTEQARQNIVYTEAHFTIGTHLSNGANGDEVLAALEEAIRAGEERLGVRLRLIPDIVRNVPALADRTLEWALAARDRGVGVALGLSGSEARFPSEPFREHFAAAAREGLHRVAHAGEHAGPASIRSVLDACGAERIGHGVRAVEDPALMAELAERGIPLEVCPSSNVCLGVVPDLAHHPFDRLVRAGCRVTVNSDDGPLFDTTLSGEYLRLHRTFGYDPAALADLALAGLSAAFLPEHERAALEAVFRKQGREQTAELGVSP